MFSSGVLEMCLFYLQDLIYYKFLKFMEHYAK